jgi:hypothetical protein
MIIPSTGKREEKEMGVSSTTRQMAVVAASLAAAAWLSSAGPAQATSGEQPQAYSQVSGTTGVCGWFNQEFSDRFETVNVCGYDGVAVGDGARDQLAGPLVIIDRYACFSHPGGGCEGEHHEVLVDRSDFVVDPLLRQARITTAAGCGVEVEFVGISAPTPFGAAWEHHGLQGGPSFGASGEQTLARPAQWWGRVCGRFLVAAPGEGHMWRSLTAGAGRYAAGGEGAERA